MEKYLCCFAHEELYVPYEIIVERIVGSTSNSDNMHKVLDDNSKGYRSMIINAIGMNQSVGDGCSIVNEESNANATSFFYLLKNFDEPLWDGCTDHNKLSVVAHVFTIKLDHGLSEVGYERVVE
jgi:hypothetical protein